MGLISGTVEGDEVPDAPLRVAAYRERVDDGAPAAAVQIEVLDSWISPATRGQYPARWKIRIPDAQIELDVEPWLPAQEMQLTFAYWEGAVRITGLSAGAAVTGNGYVEMTGYSGSMQGVF